MPYETWNVVQDVSKLAIYFLEYFEIEALIQQSKGCTDQGLTSKSSIPGARIDDLVSRQALCD